MQVIAGQKTYDMEILSFVVSPSRDDPEGIRLQMIHCTFDGYPLLQIHGNIRKILPGALPLDLSGIIRCRQCKHNYAFYFL